MKDKLVSCDDVPAILFGAFDRHNFGDLLFPHVAAALLNRKRLVYAGLAARDMRAFGGHDVQALAWLSAQFGEQPVNIIHAGGELLTCDAWQAAAMLLPPDRALATIAHFDARPAEKWSWAHRELGVPSLAPYTVQRALFPGATSVIYNAVGGVDLDQRDPALRAEVLANLRAADAVGVRDSVTHAQLEKEGIAARLMPDPAVMTAELFGTAIHRRAAHGEVGQVMSAFPQGYVAVQFSCEFGDDATLNEIAAQLDRAAHSSSMGIVLFRAGAAPWHDDLGIYRRVAARMRASVKIFESLDIWDICALIAHSRAYIGSSLHGRIVAMAFARPRINLLPPSQVSKQAAYADTWEAPGTRAIVDVRDMAEGLCEAMTADRDLLAHIAGKLVHEYLLGFRAAFTLV